MSKMENRNSVLSKELNITFSIATIKVANYFFLNIIIVIFLNPCHMVRVKREVEVELGSRPVTYYPSELSGCLGELVFAASYLLT